MTADTDWIRATLRPAYGDCCDGVWADILEGDRVWWRSTPMTEAERLFQTGRLCQRCYVRTMVLLDQRPPTPGETEGEPTA